MNRLKHWADKKAAKRNFRFCARTWCCNTALAGARHNTTTRVRLGTYLKSSHHDTRNMTSIFYAIIISWAKKYGKHTDQHRVAPMFEDGADGDTQRALVPPVIAWGFFHAANQPTDRPTIVTRSLCLLPTKCCNLCAFIIIIIIQINWSRKIIQRLCCLHYFDSQQ